MFEKASRLKVRFSTPQGQLSAEDLWDLPLTSNTNKANLDDIAKGLSRLLKSTDSEESFVLKTKPADTKNAIAFEIVKRVITVRLAENEEARKSQENKTKKQQIMNLINQKQDAALGEKSIEELTALMAGL